MCQNRTSQTSSPQPYLSGFSSRQSRGALKALTLALTVWLAAAAPVAAQFFNDEEWGPASRARRHDLDRFINGSPSFGSGAPSYNIARILNIRGFRLTEPPERNGGSIIATGQSQTGARVRFTINAYTGRLMRMDPLRVVSGRDYDGGRFTPPRRDRSYDYDDRGMMQNEPDYSYREQRPPGSRYGRSVQPEQWGAADRHMNGWNEQRRSDRQGQPDNMRRIPGTPDMEVKGKTGPWRTPPAPAAQGEPVIGKRLQPASPSVPGQNDQTGMKPPALSPEPQPVRPAEARPADTRSAETRTNDIGPRVITVPGAGTAVTTPLPAKPLTPAMPRPPEMNDAQVPR